MTPQHPITRRRSSKSVLLSYLEVWLLSRLADHQRSRLVRRRIDSLMHSTPPVRLLRKASYQVVELLFSRLPVKLLAQSSLQTLINSLALASLRVRLPSLPG